MIEKILQLERGTTDNRFLAEYFDRAITSGYRVDRLDIAVVHVLEGNQSDEGETYLTPVLFFKPDGPFKRMVLSRNYNDRGMKTLRDNYYAEGEKADEPDQYTRIEHENIVLDKPFGEQGTLAEILAKVGEDYTPKTLEIYRCRLNEQEVDVPGIRLDATAYMDKSYRVIVPVDESFTQYQMFSVVQEKEL